MGVDHMSYKEEVLEGLNFDNVTERLQDLVVPVIDKVTKVNYKKYLKKADAVVAKAKGAVEGVVDSKPVQTGLNFVKEKLNLGSQTFDV